MVLSVQHKGSDGDSVDKNKCCTLCNMSFTSAVVAESHYQGKIHAKRLKLLLGEQPALKATESTLSSLKQPHTGSAPVVPSPHPRRDSDRFCQLCAAWFNNPLMAQQHYDGKKHKKNAARADLLEQLGKTLDLGELRGLKRSYTCNICKVTLNSIEQYHAHLKGSKHQTKLSREGTCSLPWPCHPMRTQGWWLAGPELQNCRSGGCSWLCKKPRQEDSVCRQIPGAFLRLGQQGWGQLLGVVAAVGASPPRVCSSSLVALLGL
ncbi:zinc finger matrin-type protein 4 isoform X2 [Heliangelus exortis]|uniref:zinc finger matrin-type protein 4 isoform X2 n=1 Tax=Heliangelus exortis TaxID=472823 RepID=UPI003A92C95E